jgi:hypothetical protein
MPRGGTLRPRLTGGEQMQQSVRMIRIYSITSLASASSICMLTGEQRRDALRSPRIGIKPPDARR